ncbi:MAG TPA: hypothetical protein EYG38_17205 [Verrucomicrobia bacterium]|nr:hypothetical protein [Verrucomicrobiota bacterium]
MHSFGSAFRLRYKGYAVTGQRSQLQDENYRITGFPARFSLKPTDRNVRSSFIFSPPNGSGVYPTELCPKRVSTLRARRFSRQYWIAHIVQYVLNV